MKYKLIDGLPTSKYGLVVVKRCRWCYNVIQSLGAGRRKEKFGDSNFGSAVWCSEDCKQEESDWLYINNYRKTVRALKQKTLDNNNGVPRKPSRPRIYSGNDKERKHQYYLAHKEKIKKQMVEIRRRNKVEKLQTNIDKQRQ